MVGFDSPAGKENALVGRQPSVVTENIPEGECDSKSSVHRTEFPRRIPSQIATLAAFLCLSTSRGIRPVFPELQTEDTGIITKWLNGWVPSFLKYSNDLR